MTDIFTFPLEPMGKALRELSLAGSYNNLIAILCFLLFGLMPVFLWGFLKKKKQNLKEDYLLFALSGVFFYTLYYSINPGLFAVNLPGSQGIYLSGLFYSSLIAYGVIRIWNMAAEGSKGTLHRLLKIFLVILAVLFTGAAAVELFVELPSLLTEVKASYEGYCILTSMAGEESTIHLAVMEAVAFFKIMMEAVPYILDIVILVFSYHLVKSLEQDWYSEESVKAAKRLAEIAGRVLIIITVLPLIYNLLQVIGRNAILQSNLVVRIPLISIIFLLAVLLLSKYIYASQQLKNENDLFV